MSFKEEVFDRRNNLKIAIYREKQSMLAKTEKLIYENGHLFDKDVLEQLKYAKFASVSLENIFGQYLPVNYVSSDMKNPFEEFLNYKLSELDLVIIATESDRTDSMHEVVVISLKEEYHLAKRDYKVFKREEFYKRNPVLAEERKQSEELRKPVTLVFVIFLILFVIWKISY